MNRNRFLEAIREALETTEDVPEELRPMAFQEVLRSLLATEAPPARIGSDTVGERLRSKEFQEESIGEFLRGVSSSAHTDIVLAMSYFLLKSQGVESFTAKDIEALYMQARHPRSNVHLAIIGNIKKGMMLDTGAKQEGVKLYAITRLGEERVEKALLEPKSVGE